MAEKIKPSPKKVERTEKKLPSPFKHSKKGKGDWAGPLRKRD